MTGDTIVNIRSENITKQRENTLKRETGQQIRHAPQHIVKVNNTQTLNINDTVSLNATVCLTILNTSNKPILFKHGKHGKTTVRANTSPDMLLTDTLTIPPHSKSFVEIKQQTPFKIETELDNASHVLATTYDTVKPIPTPQNLDQFFSYDIIADLNSETARKLSTTLKNAVRTHPNCENFGEETVAKMQSPDFEIPSSITGMEFKSASSGNDNEQSENTNSSSHMHPGERLLLIVTTTTPHGEEQPGVTFNFAGPMDNISQNPALQRKIHFKENTLIALKFAPFTHHQFHGIWNCLSFHPREGQIFIQDLQKGGVANFLEHATIQSITDGAKIRNFQTDLPAATPTEHFTSTSDNNNSHPTSQLSTQNSAQQSSTQHQQHQESSQTPHPTQQQPSTHHNEPPSLAAPGKTTNIPSNLHITGRAIVLQQRDQAAEARTRY